MQPVVSNEVTVVAAEESVSSRRYSWEKASYHITFRFTESGKQQRFFIPPNHANGDLGAFVVSGEIGVLTSRGTAFIDYKLKEGRMSPVGSTTCVKCRTVYKNSACPACGYGAAGYWLCIDCGDRNSENSRSCLGCGKSK